MDENLRIKNFGIIGFPLLHTFSPSYFTDKFAKENIEAVYRAYALENIDSFYKLTKKIPFAGINVTIPYKERIIPYLDELDPVAAEIGAVNTIKFANGKTIGYNTDAFGFEVSLMELIDHPVNIHGALVLGSGGASLAVCYTLKKLQIPYRIVSRTSKANLRYENIDQSILKTVNLVVNTTPLGMYPNINGKPDIPYQGLNENYFLYDLVYNPEKTIFLSEGFNRGCKIKNGLDMLFLQAERSWQIWNQPEM